MQTLDQLAEIAGKDNVSAGDDPQISSDGGTAIQTAPSIVVRPASATEVQKVIQLANELKLPVIPSSSSTHFNGGALPSQGGILLDLRRMDRILEVDERNRKVMIEPGVTWTQLGTELKNHQLMTMNPLLPHGDSSVITSCLEREPWLNPRFEYGEPVMSMGLVWPTGEAYRAGTASVRNFPNSFAQGAYPYGPGPFDPLRLLQGAQGTMGVVTWANIKVEYLPPLNRAFLIPFENTSDLAEAFYAIQRRRIGNECLALNNMNLATILAKDWPRDFNTLRKTLPSWSLLLVLSGARYFPEEKIAYEQEALETVRNNVFPFAELLQVLPGFGAAEKLVEVLRHPWPEDKPYWKSLSKGSCKEVFFITLLEETPKFVETVRAIAGENGYDPAEIGLYLQPIEFSSACHLEFDFFYDANNATEKETTDKIFSEVVRETLKQDAHFTRPYGKMLADLVYEKAGSYTALLKKTKSLFDPNNIMNPGKLCF